MRPVGPAGHTAPTRFRFRRLPRGTHAVSGGPGIDTLNGNEGNDTLDGDAGNDIGK
ncbi:hypothetical protein ACFVJ8_24290 [Streptomyces yangpuensis]|uniref:hypothetical protein n=1 Tax=Streptomyces TaxID=1883 RepID=UPI000AC15197